MIAPSNAVRVLLFFRYKNFTWSETYWRAGSDSPDPTADDQAAITAATAAGGLCESRVGLLGAGVELIEIRASRDNVFRDSLVVTPYAQWQAPKGARPDLEIYNTAFCAAGGPGQVCEVAAEPEVCIRARCEATALNRRIMYLSGVPQFADVPGANVPLPATIDPTGEADVGSFNAHFQAWATAVVAGQWGYVGVQYTNSYQITRITTDVPGTTVTVQTAVAPAGISVGSTVLIFRPQYNPGSYNFHGQKEVTAVAGNQVSFATSPISALSYREGGFLRGPATRAFHLFTKVTGDVIGEHKRGFAELAIRGRSRSRRNYVG